MARRVGRSWRWMRWWECVLAGVVLGLGIWSGYELWLIVPESTPLTKVGSVFLCAIVSAFCTAWLWTHRFVTARREALALLVRQTESMHRIAVPDRPIAYRHMWRWYEQQKEAGLL